MQLIIITSAEAVAHEATIINNLFAAGLMRLHVRKPGSSLANVSKLIDQMDSKFRDRIALHQHHELANAYGITRLHYTEQARLQTTADVLKWQKQDGYILSTSIHDAALLPSLSLFDYAFFGPVFDSVSKPGYRGGLSADLHWDDTISPLKVIALGGVELGRIPAIKAMGFDGAAVLGAIWNQPENALTIFKQLQASVPVEQNIDL